MQFYVNAQEWHRNDFEINFEDENGIISLEDLNERKFAFYVLTSSNSGVRKFYFENKNNQFRLVTEVLAKAKDPYLLIDLGDTIMGLLLKPTNNKAEQNCLFKSVTIKIKPGFYSIRSIENTDYKTVLYLDDNPENSEIEATVLQNPVFVVDTKTTCKFLDKNYDYAYPFMFESQEKPKGIQVYKLDVLSR